MFTSDVPVYLNFFKRTQRFDPSFELKCRRCTQIDCLSVRRLERNSVGILAPLLHGAVIDTKISFDRTGRGFGVHQRLTSQFEVVRLH